MKLTSDKLFEAISDIDENLIINMEKIKMNKKNKMLKVLSIGAAAAAITLITIPNLSYNIAQASYDIPLIGNFFEVVTFRSYSETSDNMEINAEIPSVDTGDEDLSTELNMTTLEYTETLIAKFKEDLGEGTGSVDIDYEVITDNSTWFTLKINSTETMASGYNRAIYYHVDKTTNEIAKLSDLFENDDYINIITENIKSQMQSQMAEDESIQYILDEFGFTTITENENFYFNESGNLVISFDEYTVAPGYMGIVEFEITKDVIEY